jgi:hypothetical protein
MFQDLSNGLGETKMEGDALIFLFTKMPAPFFFGTKMPAPIVGSPRHFSKKKRSQKQYV